ncbi:MAG: PadR family transcriptional regulator [Clostridia bacterium]|nr:PadR family transcriptional regulator [Clostridia bacterium]
MPNTDNFKRGTVELVVLSVLTKKDMYGYEIVKAVEDMSGGRFSLPLGTLYPVFYRFSENGYISDYDEVVNKRLRKYYHLEEKGRVYYEELLTEYLKISEGIALILRAVNENE